MKKIITILSSLCAALCGVIAVFFYGKKNGRQEEENEILRTDNQLLQKQAIDVQQAAKVANAIDTGSVDGAIDELRKFAPKN